MKTTLICLAMGLSLFSTGSAWAQDEGERPERPRRDGEMRERMIKEFDADGNGELSDEERQMARETMRERRGDRPEGRGRGPGQGRGRGGEGRPAPPDPNKMFDEFDADKDGQLSREEFLKLTETQRDRRPPRPPREGRPGGPRPGGDDRPGPPREGREFDRQPPLQNQAGPPRGEGEYSRRGRGGEGLGPPPGPRGPEDRGPDPNRLFDRFDENGDDQLSREEFVQLSDTLRDMRERFTEGGPRGRGPRGGEFGPPDRGGRPPRPQRPEAEPEAPPADEDAGSEI